MTTNLPPSLQPTAADIARDADLARQADELLQGIRSRTGMGVKVNQQGYNSVTYGLDGSVVSRVINGVAQQSDAQEAVNAAQSSANADLMRMDTEIARLTKMRDEVHGYAADGSPQYVRGKQARDELDGQIRSLTLGRINQQRLNERRWRQSAAPAVRKADQAREIIRELEEAGRVTRVRTF